VKNKTRQEMTRVARGTPVGRFATPADWREYLHEYFYSFSDPGRRAGMGLNYLACRDSARVHPHPSGYVVFDCRRIRKPALVPGGVDPVEQP